MWRLARRENIGGERCGIDYVDGVCSIMVFTKGGEFTKGGVEEMTLKIPVDTSGRGLSLGIEAIWFSSDWMEKFYAKYKDVMHDFVLYEIYNI